METCEFSVGDVGVNHVFVAPHVTPSPKSPGESSPWLKVSQHPLAFQIFQDLEVVFFWGLKYVDPWDFKPEV